MSGKSSHGLTGYLTDAQIAQLFAGIRAHRVHTADGHSHVQAYDVRAHLIRVFGPARFDVTVESCELVFETSNEAGNRWTVCYRAVVKLVVRAPDGTHLATYSDVATGDAKNQPSRSDAHDLAAKAAASGGLKRAAVNLGDQFGLSLYNKGQMAPFVGGSLVGRPEEPTAPVDEHITTAIAVEDGETETQRETSSPPAERAATSTTPAQPPAPSPAADTSSSQEGGVGEEAAAVAAVASSFPGAAEAEAEAETEDEAYTHVVAEIDRATRTTPQEGMEILKAAMEVVTRRRLAARKMADSTITLGARITALMGKAQTAIDNAAA